MVAVAVAVAVEMFDRIADPGWTTSEEAKHFPSRDKSKQPKKKRILFEKLELQIGKFFREIFFRDFKDVIWVENLFKPIRVINRTNSRSIWTRTDEDIEIF